MTDHYREAEQHLGFAAKSTDHPETERAHLAHAQAHAMLALIDQFAARPHVDITGTAERIDMTTFADRANGYERTLIDGVQYVSGRGNGPGSCQPIHTDCVLADGHQGDHVDIEGRYHHD